LAVGICQGAAVYCSSTRYGMKHRETNVKWRLSHINNVGWELCRSQPSGPYRKFYGGFTYGAIAIADILSRSVLFIFGIDSRPGRIKRYSCLWILNIYMSSIRAQTLVWNPDLCEGNQPSGYNHAAWTAKRYWTEIADLCIWRGKTISFSRDERNEKWVSSKDLTSNLHCRKSKHSRTDILSLVAKRTQCNILGWKCMVRVLHM